MKRLPLLVPMRPPSGAWPLAAMMGLLLSACAGEQVKAGSWIGPAGGTTVTGRAQFVQEKAGLSLIAHVRGLSPEAAYSLQVSDRTDCAASARAQAFESLPVKADAYGIASFSAVLPGLTLLDGKRLAGKTVSVRRAPDDSPQASSAASGAEVGCGTVDR